MDPTRNYATWVPVTSSNVEAVLWFERRGRGVLCVRFIGKGKRPSVVYEYPGAGEEYYHGMLDAPSKGKYLNAVIIPRFKHVGPLAA